MNERAPGTGPEPCTTCGHARKPAKTRKLGAERVKGRARFADFFKGYLLAAADRGVTLRGAWAHRLEVSRQTIEQWGNPLEAHGVIGAGDLEGLALPDLEQLLHAWLESVRARLDPPTPARDLFRLLFSLMTSAAEIGKTVEILGDRNGRCGVDDLARVERGLAAHERDTRLVKLAVRALRLQSEGRPWTHGGTR